MRIRRNLVNLAAPIAAAVFVTFDRFGFLPFEGLYTPLDQAINYFVVVAAPLLVLLGLRRTTLRRFVVGTIPALLLLGYIAIHLLFTPIQIQPSFTELVSISLAIGLCLSVSPSDLRTLRRSILALGLLFNLFVALFGSETLHYILVTDVSRRLGVEISAANGVILPRVLYVVVLTAIASFFLEQRAVVRAGCVAIAGGPFVVAMATGGRGPLVALFASVLLLSLLLSRRSSWHTLALTTSALAFIYISITYIVPHFFPLMEERIISASEGNERLDIWAKYINEPITLFGNGMSEYYPHNIFIEMLYDYGVVGLSLFLCLLATSLRLAFRWIYVESEPEAALILALIALELTAQMFSLNIYYAGLWAALVLPLNILKKPSGPIPRVAITFSND